MFEKGMGEMWLCWVPRHHVGSQLELLHLSLMKVRKYTEREGIYIYMLLI